MPEPTQTLLPMKYECRFVGFSHLCSACYTPRFTTRPAPLYRARLVVEREVLGTATVGSPPMQSS